MGVTSTSPAGSHSYLLRFDSSEHVPDLSARIKRIPGVLIAEPNYIGRLAYEVTDPNYGQHKEHLVRIGVPEAWNVQCGADPSVLVAVIDSGVDGDHEDLRAGIHPASYDFVLNSTEVIDTSGHGTRVCGIIGAQANNDLGIAGVAFGCRLLVCRVVDSAGNITVDRVKRAIDYAVEQGADVINLSLEFFAESQMLRQSCDSASQRSVLAAASGNSNQGESPVFPASFSSVLGVGATNLLDDLKAPFSNFNGAETSLVSLVAPGVGNYTTTPRSGYDGRFSTGTSFSAPLVSGVAALLRAKYPSQTPLGLVRHLEATAVPLAAWAGHGRLSAQDALQTNLHPDILFSQIVIDDSKAFSAQNDVDGSWDQGETVSLRIELRNEGGDADNITGTLSTSEGGLTIHSATGVWGRITTGSAGQVHDTGSFLVTAAVSATARDASFTLSALADGGYATQIVFQTLIESTERWNGDIIHGASVTWVAGKTYEVHGSHQFNGGLTIEPGTTVKMAPDAELDIPGGNLSAVGEAGNPIEFIPLAPYPNSLTVGATGEVGPRTIPVATSAYAEVFYVAVETGLDSPANGTQGAPWATLSYALSQVGPATSGSKIAILAAGGIYPITTTLQMEQFVDLFGGFETGSWLRDITLYPTVLDGGGTQQILLTAPNTRLDGFVLRGGAAVDGAAVYCTQGSPVLTNNIFEGNTASHWGGAIYTEDASPFLEGNLFRGNKAVLGAAVFGRSCTITFSRNEVSSNRAEGGSIALGGGLYLDGNSASTLIANCLIAGNTAATSGSGGGIYAKQGSLVMTGTTLVNNYAVDSGGGVFLSGLTADIQHTLLAANKAGSQGGSAVYAYQATGSLKKSSFVGNRAAGAVQSCIKVVSSPDFLFAMNRVSGNTGHGIHCLASDTAIQSSVFSSNTGSGIYCEDSSPPIANDTIFGNADGITASDFSVPSIAGAIVYSNLGSELFLPGGTVNYSDIRGGAAGTENIEEDPEYLDDALWGVATDVLLDASAQTSLLSVPALGLPAGRLAGRVLRIGTDSYGILSNETGRLTIAGLILTAVPFRFEIERTYHLSKSSPCIGKGSSVDAPPNDLDGEARSGLPDMGADEFNPSSALFSHWRGIQISTQESGSHLAHCLFDGGSGVIDDSAGTTLIEDCTVTNHNGSGLTVNGTGPALLRLTSVGNCQRGIDASERDLLECKSWYNVETGLIGSALDDCLASGNTGDGMSGNRIASSSSMANGGDGIAGVLEIVSSTAERNLGNGLIGSCSDSVSIRNGAAGIQGTALRCVVIGNGGDGVIGGAQDSRIVDNQGYGVSGAGLLAGCELIGNQAGAATGLTAIEDCIITENGSGVSGASQISNSYIALNNGAGVTGGMVLNSTVIGNEGIGVSQPDSLQNSWVLFNHGTGVDSPLGDVVHCSIIGSTSHGVANIAAGTHLAFCNLHGSHNEGRHYFDYFDESGGASGPVQNRLKDCRFNYWGETTSPLMAATPFDPTATNIPDIPAIWDVIDTNLSDGWYANYGEQPGEFFTDTIPDSPDVLAPPCVIDVQTHPAGPVNVGLATFTLVFSSTMDLTVDPVVTFDSAFPFTAHVLAPIGWDGTRTWSGVFGIYHGIGDGTNTLSISSARAANGFTIPTDKSHTFRIDTSGASAGTSLQAVAVGASAIEVTWQSSDSAALDNFRLLRAALVPSNFEEIDIVPVDEATTEYLYVDQQGLLPGTTYFYRITEIFKSGTYQAFNRDASATTFALTPTPTPTASVTATVTETPEATFTETSTPTPTDSPIPPPTSTSTPSQTATNSETVTPTVTATDTPSPSPTATFAPGDMDGDGDLDTDDVLLFSQKWKDNSSGPGNPANIAGGEDINAQDLILLMEMLRSN